jgi:type I site-specific restriction-modification system R (restriction) subunit
LWKKFHDKKHENVLAEKEKALQEASLQFLATNTQYIENTDKLIELGKLGPMPITHYDTEAQAIKHNSQLENLITQIENKTQEADPYSEQIVETENKALQEINFDKINKLTRTMEHQKFLLDLLTSKDSFVRKKIIDQNLSYLNGRLTHYLDKTELPHQVIFKNDLQVEITERVVNLILTT